MKHVCAVAPDVIAITLQAGQYVGNQLIPYVAEPGDEIQQAKNDSKPWREVEDGKTVSLTDSQVGRIKFRRCIIAVGSRPVFPSVFDIGSPRVMASRGALALEDVPASLLVVGGGYIGLELGTVYHALGTKVTVRPKAGGKGEIVVEYFSLDDLDRILDLLTGK